jgi:hypothetical protein
MGGPTGCQQHDSQPLRTCPQLRQLACRQRPAAPRPRTASPPAAQLPQDLREGAGPLPRSFPHLRRSLWSPCRSVRRRPNRTRPARRDHPSPRPVRHQSRRDHRYDHRQPPPGRDATRDQLARTSGPDSSTVASCLSTQSADLSDQTRNVLPRRGDEVEHIRACRLLGIVVPIGQGHVHVWGRVV